MVVMCKWNGLAESSLWGGVLIFSQILKHFVKSTFKLKFHCNQYLCVLTWSGLS